MPGSAPWPERSWLNGFVRWTILIVAGDNYRLGGAVDSRLARIATPVNAGKRRQEWVSMARRLEIIQHVGPSLSGCVGIQHVTAGSRHQQAAIGRVGLDLLAQAIDMGFQRMRRHAGVVTPHFVQQHLP
jgi:hypothetical protein